MEKINNFYENKPVEYAGFWLRFVAFLIDNIICSTITWIIAIPITLLTGLKIFDFKQMQEINSMSPEEQALIISSIVGSFSVLIIFSQVIQWIYFALMESSERQATVGKIALGLKVTDMEGRRISFLNATGRYFGKIISSTIMFIGYIMAGFTEKKQALHDIIAGCIVVKK